MPDILGAISSQKTATMSRIEWHYHGESEKQAELLVETIREANDKANRIAASLGVELLGVRQFRETVQGKDTPDVFESDFSMARTRGAATVDLGVNINHSKSITLHVEVDYRISGFKPNGG